MSFRAGAGSVSSVSVDAYLEDGSLETFQNYTLGNYNWLLDSVVRQALYHTGNIAEFRRDYAVPLCVCCVSWARARAWLFVAMFAISKGGSILRTGLIRRRMNGARLMAMMGVLRNFNFRFARLFVTCPFVSRSQSCF